MTSAPVDAVGGRTDISATPVIGANRWPSGQEPIKLVPANGKTTRERHVEQMLEELAEALAGALRAAVAESAIAEPFLLLVGHDPGRPALPPVGWLAGSDWVERVRGAEVTARDVLESVRRGHVQRLDIPDRLDAESAALCRATAADPARLDPVRTRLTTLLDEHVDCFVAVVTGSVDEPLAGRLVAGTDVDAFRRLLAGG